MEEGQDYKSNLNPNSLEVITAMAEPSIAESKAMARYQIERMAISVQTSEIPCRGKPIFNRTVGLRDSWAKIMKK